MATVIGDRDVLLLGSSQRALNPLGADILLQLSAPLFKVDTSGNPLPSTITITANLISLSGTVSFSASGATVTNNNDNTATVAYSSLTGNTCTITASLTSNGQSFSRSVQISKLADGASGTSGTSGNQYATVYLYQWATSTPAKPNGTSGYTWATGVNSTYNGTDQWQINPTNPGTPGMTLYVAAVPITAAGGTASTVVSYTNASIQIWSQNGTNGSNGVSGYQSATIQVYRWDSSTIPAGPAGTGTYTWSSGGFGAAPTNWTLAPGVAPSQGMTLWAAKLQIIDSATVTQTGYNWSSAAIVAVGSSGSNGAAGASGASYVTAYCASATGTTSTAPAQTTGKTSLPATDDGGIIGTWYSTVPTLSVNQYLYQSDGIYDPTTNKVTWSIPYWSSLKVGSLSAITANLGSINAGSIDLGSGKIVLQNDGTAIFRKITIVDDSTGATILNAGGLSAAYAAPGTLNDQQQWSDVNGRPSDDSIKNNLIDLSLWRKGSIPAWPVNGEGNAIFPCGPSGTTDLTPAIPGPKGGNDLVWYCQEQTGDGQQGGGWDAPYFTLDPTKTYRFVVPIRRMSGSGQSYWGTQGVATLNSTTLYSTSGGPYFVNGVALPNSDRWYLFVGFIYPANSTGNTHDSAGVWDCKTGAPIASGTNFCFMPDGRQVNHRAYQYYASLNAQQLFGRPMINLVDGTEPSLREYFDAAALLNSQQQWSDVQGSGKPDNNATVGAPSGTLVGSTLAQTVESNASNGNSAYNSVNDATNGLAQKLKSNAQNILAGGGGLSAGTLVWDGSGTRTSGYGVGMNQKGIVAYNSSGVATFTLDGTTGNATFAGTLSAATGTFAGSLSAASGTLGTITAATIQSGSSGQRTVITQNGVNVYDSAGTLRVRMGIW